jgi:hypothetical protein
MRRQRRVGIGLLFCCVACGLFASANIWADGPGLPPVMGRTINRWGFNDTNWLSLRRFPPLAFTNIAAVPSWNGCALQVDSAAPAFLKYREIETNGFENIRCDVGGLQFWTQPNWSSTNLGGTGPGTWARFIELGTFTTNASTGWWSLYLDAAGSTIFFAGQTNGAEAVYLQYPIAWASNEWHHLALSYTATNSKLYLDGQLATNGAGVAYWPDATVRSNGLCIGSDNTGVAQVRGQMESLGTYAFLYDYCASNHFVRTN